MHKDTVMWAEIDDDAVRYSRALAMDAVQRVGNGHPGTAMSLAPAATLLFREFVRHDPRDPGWLGRDRFVLSAGHSSLTLYTQLFLSGTGVELTDLEHFRTWGSRTPGHPEFGHTPGVETTTGPLGQGVATGVGMAMAARYERHLFDPTGTDSPFDTRVWVLASDGDLQEGVSGEASSLAGTQALSNLCVVWDDNHISIEGDTARAFTEDVCGRYRAYGWDTHTVDMLANGDVDLVALRSALQQALTSDRPTFIALRTTIAWPAPNAQNTAKSHGSALGPDEVAATKIVLGLDPASSFVFPAPVLDGVRAQRLQRAEALRDDWEARYQSWRQREPERAALLDRLLAGALPADLDAHIPTFEPGSAMATRKASGLVLNAVAPVLPELWGGSADLAESNNTHIEGSASFLPTQSGLGRPDGRVIHFGVREHAMGAIVNGIALDGLTRPFAGTFLVFSDYMRGAVRLSALMDLAVTYIWTHDSIGLGEDGPTHQPIEHLWALRAIPNLAVVRPADANETAAAWRTVLHQRSPVGLILSRQDLPVLATAEAAGAGVARGGYVLRDVDDPSVLLLASGSEVSIAVAAADLLATDGIGARVISMPCLEWFDAQDQAYRESVLPPSVRPRVSIEAGATQGWWRYVGTGGTVIGLDHFGASADGATLYTEFGLTPAAVAAAARSAVERAHD